MSFVAAVLNCGIMFLHHWVQKCIIWASCHHAVWCNCIHTCNISYSNILQCKCTQLLNPVLTLSGTTAMNLASGSSVLWHPVLRLFSAPPLKLHHVLMSTKATVQDYSTLLFDTIAPCSLKCKHLQFWYPAFRLCSATPSKINYTYLCQGDWTTQQTAIKTLPLFLHLDMPCCVLWYF